MYMCVRIYVLGRYTVHKTDPVLSSMDMEAKRDTVSTIVYAEETYSTLTNTPIQFKKSL